MNDDRDTIDFAPLAGTGPDAQTAPIRIDAETARKLKTLAEVHGTTVADLVRPHLGAWVDALYDQAVSRAVRSLDAPPTKPGP